MSFAPRFLSAERFEVICERCSVDDGNGARSRIRIAGCEEIAPRRQLRRPPSSGGVIISKCSIHAV